MKNYLSWFEVLNSSFYYTSNSIIDSTWFYRIMIYVHNIWCSSSEHLYSWSFYARILPLNGSPTATTLLNSQNFLITNCNAVFEFLMHLHRNHGTSLFLFFTVAEPAQRVKYVTWDMACGATASVQASCYVIQNFKHTAMKQNANAKQLVLASQYQKRGAKNTILQYIYMFAQLKSMVKCKKKNKYLNSKHMMPCSHQLWMHGCLTRETLVQQLARSTPVTSPLLQSANHMKSLITSQTWLEFNPIS